MKKYMGLASGLYMAVAYLIGIIIFIAVLKYPAITNDMEKVTILLEMESMVFLTNLLMYVLFGPVLVIFILQLKERLNDEKSLLISFSSVVGFIWAGSLTASGMIGNGAIGPIINMYQQDPERALYFWQIIDSVSLSIGNGNGEILGGLMTLGFGAAMYRSTAFSKGLGIFAMLIGVIGVLSLIPALLDLAVIFGLLQLVWFVLTGIKLGIFPIYNFEE